MMKQCYRVKYLLLLLIAATLMFTVGCGCRPSADDLASVDYTPIEREDWEISTPENEGIDPELVAEVYYNAAKLDTIYSLLVVKNGKLIGEKYYNNGSINDAQIVTDIVPSSAIWNDIGGSEKVAKVDIQDGFTAIYVDQVDLPGLLICS